VKGEYGPVSPAEYAPLQGARPLATPEIGIAKLVPDISQRQEIPYQANKGNNPKAHCYTKRHPFNLHDERPPFELHL